MADPNFTALAMTTAVIAVGSTEAKRLANRQAPTIRPVLAGFILGLFLFGAGLVNEYITTLFCYLIILTSLLLNGAELFTLIKF